jgi:hypothetical protein
LKVKVNDAPTLDGARTIIFPKDDTLRMAHAKRERQYMHKTTTKQSLSN